MKSTGFPCYVQVVYDLFNGIEPKLENYPDFAKRSHLGNDFRAWVAYAKMAKYIVQTCTPNLNAQKEYAKAAIEFINKPCNELFKKLDAVAQKLGIKNPYEQISNFEKAAAEFDIPNYHLLPEEYKTILRAEEYGRGKPGVMLEYCGKFGHKQVLSIDYRKIPANKDGRIDVVLVYSGHQQTGHKASELAYQYLKNNGKLPDYIFNIGFEDNQNMTDFSPEFTYRKRSEADTYANEEIALGLPEQWIRQLWLDPTDTDTWQNIKVVALLKKRFGLDKINLIIVGYPVYQLRTATEFAWGLEHAAEAPDCNIIIADIPPKTKGMATMEEASCKEFDEYRVLSYNQPLYQLGDLSLANCCAHIHLRTSGNDQCRYAIPDLVAYPDEFKPLAPMFMSYSYPNVISAIFGSEGEEKEKDENVAKVMKILRYLQLCKYDEGMSGAAMDVQEQWYVKQTIRKFQQQKLTGMAIIEETRYMDKKEAEECILAFQDLLAAE